MRVQKHRLQSITRGHSALEEGVRKYLVDAYPLFWPPPQNAVDEVPGLVFHLAGILIVDCLDAVHGLCPTDVVEGRLAGDYLEGQHSNAPDVHAVIVGLPLDYLGRNVVKGAAVGGSPLFLLEDSCPP